MKDDEGKGWKGKREPMEISKENIIIHIYENLCSTKLTPMTKMVHIAIYTSVLLFSYQFILYIFLLFHL